VSIGRSESVFDHKVVICVGTGGVGKTTVSAALALEAARRGKRALVLTVDPARRLADALGAGELGASPRPVTGQQREELGIEEGELFAMMLDTKGTFDALVERLAPDPRARDRIFSNRIYAHLSDALAGSSEYAAMEQVYEISQSAEYDWIVVDTPPSQHALDFLDAPRRMLEFLDSRVVQTLVHPAFAAGRFGARFFERGTRQALHLIERVTGMAFLEDLSEFLLAIEEMSDGFRVRAHRVQEQLLGDEAAFVLVAAPSPQAAAAAERFLGQLDEAGARVRGIVGNRVRRWPAGEGREQLEHLRSGDCNEAIDSLARALSTPDRDGACDAETALTAATRYASLVALDEQTCQPLHAAARARGCFYRDVPELARDVHDLSGLLEVASEIFRGDADPAATP
jgi:anion-transporting  ArsA/GET3 family ATPase